nr:hypothetical protein K-LCC10_0302 [Kaumoebavirus]
MDSSTFILLSTFFPPEILTLIETYLIDAYRRDHKIVINFKSCHTDARQSYLTIEDKRYTYTVCGRCKKLVTNVRTKKLHRYSNYCEHVKAYYSNKAEFVVEDGALIFKYPV